MKNTAYIETAETIVEDNGDCTYIEDCSMCPLFEKRCEENETLLEYMKQYVKDNK